jgi:hypothetical protein
MDQKMSQQPQEEEPEQSKRMKSHGAALLGAI